jgi:SprT protein
VNRKEIETDLREYLPINAVEKAVDIMIEHKVYLNITKARQTKLGDFKVPNRGGIPKISVNYDLNPYSFLITFLHETAHYIVWKDNIKQYRFLKPHGKEWKITFKRLIEPFLNTEIFPENLLNLLQVHMQNPKASSVSDTRLYRELKKYDKGAAVKTLGDLNTGNIFLYKNRKFKILTKKRTRFVCEDIMSKRRFLIHSLVEVSLAE